MSEDPHFWAKRAFDRSDDRFEKQMSAAIDAASLTIRSAVILNGAAAIAILSFMAAGAGGASTSPRMAQFAAAAIESVHFFAWGSFAAVVAAALSYLTNRSYADAIASQQKSFTWPHLINGPKAEVLLSFGTFFNFLAVFATVASLLLFGFGVYQVQSPEIDMEIDAGKINSVAIVLTTLGFILVFFFAMPYRTRTGGNLSLGIGENTFPEMTKKILKTEKIYTALSWLGFTAVFTGAGIQTYISWYH